MKENIKIVPSGREDYCCECDSVHGYDCPKDKSPEDAPEHEKTYTFGQLMEDRKEVARNYYIILNYILNKNSYPLPRGVDHDKLFDDIQDFEEHLREDAF